MSPWAAATSSRHYDALMYLANAPWADSIAVGMQSFEEIDAKLAVFTGSGRTGASRESCATKSGRSWCTTVRGVRQVCRPLPSERH
jgi:hypothetical protein